MRKAGYDRAFHAPSTSRGVVNLVTVTITGYPFTSMVPFAMPSITSTNG